MFSEEKKHSFICNSKIPFPFQNDIPDFGIQNALSISVLIVQTDIANTSLSKAITYVECWIRASLNGDTSSSNINQTVSKLNEILYQKHKVYASMYIVWYYSFSPYCVVYCIFINFSCHPGAPDSYR